MMTDAMRGTRIHYTLGSRWLGFWFFWLLPRGECVPHSFQRKLFLIVHAVDWVDMTAL